MATQRSVLLLCRAAPYGHPRARDALDLAMAFGAFDQAVGLLLLGDGVLMMKLGQQDRPGQGRNLERLAGVLPDYGIERVYVERRALAERGLDAAGLSAQVEYVDEADVARLIAAHDVVLSL